MINKTVLANGIRIISQRIPHSCSASVGFWVNAGSRDELPVHNGANHFIEHLLFKGTERRSAFDIARESDSLGGVFNAFTGREFVCYYAKVLVDFLPQAVDLLADLFLNSTFPAEEVENERKVILQEIRMLEDNPDDHVHDLFLRNFWQGHPLGMPIIGTEETVSAMSRDFLASYRQETYRGADIIITVAGLVDHDALVAMLSGYLEALPPGSCRRPAAPPEYSKKCGRLDRNMEQLLLCLGTRALPQSHQLRHDSLVFNTILGGSMSSRLFQEVREKEGLAYSVYSSLAAHSDTGALIISAGTTAEKFPRVMSILQRELGRLKAEPPTFDEIEAAKAQLKGHILLSLESSDNVMSRLAKNEIYLGGYQSVEQFIDGFSAVTRESLLELAARLVDDRVFTLQLLGNLSGINFDTNDIYL